MTDVEWLAKLDADFDRLKRNRDNVPLEKLQTIHAKSYNALVASVTEAADWFADRYLETLTESWPRHPKDTAGNDWLTKKVANIIAEENRPGGFRDRWRAAIIDHLDRAEFEQLVFERFDRCRREAFDPYWQRHNRWTGQPENRWIFNDIIARFWLPPGADPNWPEGAWINTRREVYTTNWPPNIGPDTGPVTVKEETT